MQLLNSLGSISRIIRKTEIVAVQSNRVARLSATPNLSLPRSSDHAVYESSRGIERRDIVTLQHCQERPRHHVLVVVTTERSQSVAAAEHVEQISFRVAVN